VTRQDEAEAALRQVVAELAAMRGRDVEDEVRRGSALWLAEAALWWLGRERRVA